MKDEPWSPYHILKDDDLISGSSLNVPTFLPHKNYTFAYDLSCVEQLSKWLKPPLTIGRLKKFFGRLNPISKEKRMSTKKKLRTKIKNLESTIESIENAAERWEEAYNNSVKKYKALQQAICYLSEKAEIIQIEKDVFAPKPFSW